MATELETSNALKSANDGGSSLTLSGLVVDGASAVAVVVDAPNKLLTSGAKIVSVRNEGVEKASIDKDGNVTATSFVGPIAGALVGNLSATAATGEVITAHVANAGTNVALIVNNDVTLSGTTLLASIRNNGTEKFNVQDDGAVLAAGLVTATGGFSGALAGAVTGNVTGNLTGNVTGDVTAAAAASETITGNVANAGTNANVIVDSSVALSGTTKLLSVRNNATEKFSVEDDGQVLAVGALSANSGGATPGGISTDGRLQQLYTTSVASPGPATINKSAGKSAILTGAATVTITTDHCAATDIVLITPIGRDATAISLEATPGNGSFVVTSVANATGTTAFSWLIVKTV